MFHIKMWLLTPDIFGTNGMEDVTTEHCWLNKNGYEIQLFEVKKNVNKFTFLFYNSMLEKFFIVIRKHHIQDVGNKNENFLHFTLLNLIIQYFYFILSK